MSKFIQLKLVSFQLNERGKKSAESFNAMVFEARLRLDQAGEYGRVDDSDLILSNQDYEYKNEDYDAVELPLRLRIDQIESYNESDDTRVRVINTIMGTIYTVKETIEELDDLIWSEYNQVKTKI